MGNLAKLLFAGALIVGIVVTSLQPVVQDILNDINPDQSQGVDLSVKDHYDLAGAAKLTMDRATECTIVAERTYQDLAGTEIGRNPECSRTILPAPPLRDRAPETAEGDGFGAVTGPGNDVEGVDGKLTFNITKSGGIILRSKGVQNQGPQELGAELYNDETKGYGTPVGRSAGGEDTKGGPLKVAGVSTQAYGNIVKSESSCSGVFSSPSSDGTKEYEFIVTFENPPDGVENRITNGEGAFDLAQSSSNGVFCGAGDTGAPVSQVGNGLSMVKLCKGDRGYIQVNKGEPTGDAQTEDPEGSDTFAYIQITDAVENCNVNIDRIIEPFPEQTEHGGKVSGDTLRLELNEDEDDYPGMSRKADGRAFDLVESENAGDIARFSYEGQVPDNECSVSLKEREPDDPINQESEEWINYPSGTQIPSVGGFPARSNAVRASEDFSGSRAAKLYSKLSSDGLTKASIGPRTGTGDLLVSTDQTDRFEMYGPLACGKDGGQESRWHLCVTKGSDAAGTRDKELNTDADSETELKCTESGWESQNPRNAGQETPDSIRELSFTPKYPEVFYTEGDKARFLPAQSARADYLVWEDDAIPGGAKEVKITMSFKKRGHLQIDLQQEATGSRTEPGGSTSYIQTNEDGVNRDIYGLGTGGYKDTEVDYPVNQDFTVVVERSGGETSWRLETGGDTQQLISPQDTPDFSRIVLESHDEEAAPEIDIHSFSVTETE